MCLTLEMFERKMVVVVAVVFVAVRGERKGGKRKNIFLIEPVLF